MKSIRMPRAGHPTFSVTTTLSAAALFALALSGCARHPVPNSDTPTHSVTLQVNNNLVDVVPIDVWLREGTDAGANRRELGTVTGNETRTFTFTPSMYGQQYILEGDNPLGSPIKSQPFSVDNDGITQVKWTLDHNVVTYFGPN